MAARKNATAPKKKFLVVWSDCGDNDQLEVMSQTDTGKKFLSSLEETKKQTNTTVDVESLSGEFYVVEVVAEGRVGGNVNWK